MLYTLLSTAFSLMQNIVLHTQNTRASITRSFTYAACWALKNRTTQTSSAFSKCLESGILTISILNFYNFPFSFYLYFFKFFFHLPNLTTFEILIALIVAVSHQQTSVLLIKRMMSIDKSVMRAVNEWCSCLRTISNIVIDKNVSNAVKWNILWLF